MAIAIALIGFNDLGRTATPAFLFRNRFNLQLSHLIDQSVSHLLTHSIDQSINQLIDQSTNNRSMIDQSVGQPIDKSNQTIQASK